MDRRQKGVPMDAPTFAMLVQDHARFPSALLHLFQGASADALRIRETETRWSPLEILAHLRDEETTDFRARARRAIAGEELELNVDPEAWVTERRYNEMDPGAVYLDFAEERADSCRWLETLTLADLQCSVDHPKIGTLRAGDFIAAWRMHDWLHLRQFARAMAWVTAQQLQGWKVEYAGYEAVRGMGPAE
ncbi:MAG: DinB family protein [Gemmatimonadetes bacterium]|nr:DinB family protein [Gemmatimonadota bacterium]